MSGPEFEIGDWANVMSPTHVAHGLLVVVTRRTMLAGRYLYDVKLVTGRLPAVSGQRRARTLAFDAHELRFAKRDAMGKRGAR